MEDVDCLSIWKTFCMCSDFNYRPWMDQAIMLCSNKIFM